MKNLLLPFLFFALVATIQTADAQTTNIPNTSWQWENHSNFNNNGSKFLGIRPQGNYPGWPVFSILHEKPTGSGVGDRQTTVDIRSRNKNYMGQLRFTTLLIDNNTPGFPQAVIGSGNDQKSFGIRYWKSGSQKYQLFEVKNGDPKNLYLLDHAAGGDKVVVRGDLKICANGSCDYVFADDYDLRSIEEFEAFIKENKHLPGVKSDAEVKEDGEVDLLGLSFSLLEKVEELSLYVIDLNKQVKALKEENKGLKKAQMVDGENDKE